MKRLPVFFAIIKLAALLAILPVFLAAEPVQPTVEFSASASGLNPYPKVADLTLTMADLESLERESAEKKLQQINALATQLWEQKENTSTRSYASDWVKWSNAKTHFQQGSQYNAAYEERLLSSPPEPTTEALKDYYEEIRLAEEFARSEELARRKSELAMKELEQKQEELALKQAELALAQEERRLERERLKEQEDDFIYYGGDYLGCSNPCRNPNHHHGKPADYVPHEKPVAKHTNFLKIRDIASYSRIPPIDPCPAPVDKRYTLVNSNQ